MRSFDARLESLEKKLSMDNIGPKSLNAFEAQALGLEVELVEYLTPFSTPYIHSLVKKYRKLWPKNIWLDYLKNHCTRHNDPSEPGEWWARLTEAQKDYLLTGGTAETKKKLKSPSLKD